MHPCWSPTWRMNPHSCFPGLPFLKGHPAMAANVSYPAISSDPNNIIHLQLHTDLRFLLFIANAMSISVQALQMASLILISWGKWKHITHYAVLSAFPYLCVTLGMAHFPVLFSRLPDLSWPPLHPLLANLVHHFLTQLGIIISLSYS